MSKMRKQNQQLKWTIVVAVGIMMFLMMNLMSKHEQDPRVVNFSQFKEQLDLPAGNADKIVKVTIKKNDDIVAVTKEGMSLTVHGPRQDAELRQELLQKGVDVSYQPEEESSLWKSMLVNSIPMLLILFLFFILMRQLQVGGGKAMSFGKSRAKLQNENRPKITFKDVAGVEEAKTELVEIVDFLKDPKKFTRLGGRIPKGVLLVGPPGTGKTVLAKAISGEAGVPFFSISGSEFVEMFVGVGASRVRDLFEQAKKNAPCIIFIDEIDAVGRQRGAGLGGGHDEREQTLNQLLVEMDGFETNEGVILIAATNRVDVLDPALLRPGRFDRTVHVPKPDVRGRLGILKVHARKTPLGDKVDLKVIAQGTPGFSGADLENLVNEASLIAARVNSGDVAMTHFEKAKDKILMGPERRSMLISEDEKKNTAYHESGHCLVAKLIPGTDPVHKITIIPRGHALGVTVLLPEADRLTMTKEGAEGMIAYAMGGRAAEMLIFGQYTTGAGNDIEKATSIAKKMVCNWGMSEKLGPVALGGNSQEVFLGREFGSQESYSNQLLETIDEEVRSIVTTAYDKAYKILEDNRHILDNMAEALLIRESLGSKELDELMKGEPIIDDHERADYEKRKQKAIEDFKKELEAPLPEEVLAEEESESDKKDDESKNLDPMPQGT